MATSEERMKILKMIEEGKLTPEEGAKLLAALAESRKPPRRPLGRSASGGARWLRVRVTDTVTGKPKATVNLPLNPFQILDISERFYKQLKQYQFSPIATCLERQNP